MHIDVSNPVFHRTNGNHEQGSEAAAYADRITVIPFGHRCVVTFVVNTAPPV